MPRRKKARGLGTNRGRYVVPDTLDRHRRALARRREANKQCPLFGKKATEAIRTSTPTSSRMQPVFFHRIRLAEDAASRGRCGEAYREIGQAKRFGRRYQTRDDG